MCFRKEARRVVLEGNVHTPLRTWESLSPMAALEDFTCAVECKI